MSHEKPKKVLYAIHAAGVGNEEARTYLSKAGKKGHEVAEAHRIEHLMAESKILAEEQNLTTDPTLNIEDENGDVVPYDDVPPENIKPYIISRHEGAIHIHVPRPATPEHAPRSTPLTLEEMRERLKAIKDMLHD